MPLRNRWAAAVAIALTSAAGPSAALPPCQGYTVDVGSPSPGPGFEGVVGERVVGERVVGERIAPDAFVVRTGRGSSIAAAAGMEIGAAGQAVCLIALSGAYHTRVRLQAPGVSIERVGLGVCTADSGICEWVELSGAPASTAAPD